MGTVGPGVGHVQKGKAGPCSKDTVDPGSPLGLPNVHSFDLPLLFHVFYSLILTRSELIFVLHL